MLRLGMIACAVAVAFTSLASTATPAEREVTFRAPDGTAVYGWYREAAAGGPLIVLFHQAASSHHEYDRIVPSLNALGFATLAVDQRAGGPMFGANLTRRAFRDEPSYLAALPDMEAAVGWAAARHPREIIVWGSSYSAALVFLVAAHDARVEAVVAFSPGEYFDDKHLVRRAAAMLRIPIFADSAASTDEIAQARAILETSPSARKTQYLPRRGIHGSSTLLADRDPSGAAENRAAVTAFLRTLH